MLIDDGELADVDDDGDHASSSSEEAVDIGEAARELAADDADDNDENTFIPVPVDLGDDGADVSPDGMLKVNRGTEVALAANRTDGIVTADGRAPTLANCDHASLPSTDVISNDRDDNGADGNGGNANAVNKLDNGGGQSASGISPAPLPTFGSRLTDHSNANGSLSCFNTGDNGGISPLLLVSPNELLVLLLLLRGDAAKDKYWN
jgi:hypothetical protein